MTTTSRLAHRLIIRLRSSFRISSVLSFSSEIWSSGRFFALNILLVQMLNMVSLIILASHSHPSAGLYASLWLLWASPVLTAHPRLLARALLLSIQTLSVSFFWYVGGEHH